MDDSIKFSGVVAGVLSDKRSAVVKIDGATGTNREYAIINSSTFGRDELLNGVGIIEQGAKVEGNGHAGPEAIIADSIRLI